MNSIDIVKKGCSKGAAILKLKELLDIKEIAGIGDSYNDLSICQMNFPYNIKRNFLSI